jgi:hypothetical protein
VCHTSRDDNHIAGMHLDVLAVLAVESQSCRAAVNTKYFMRRAVVMRKGIDAVSPRIGLIVLRKALFKNRRRILGVGRDGLPIEQQRQHAIWENGVVLETELFRLNKVSLLDHKRHLLGNITQEKSELVLATVKLSEKPSHKYAPAVATALCAVGNTGLQMISTPHRGVATTL